MAGSWLAPQPLRGACSQMLRANLDRMARRIDPLTNLPLRSLELTPDRTLRTAIEECARQGRGRRDFSPVKVGDESES